MISSQLPESSTMDVMEEKTVLPVAAARGRLACSVGLLHNNLKLVINTCRLDYGILDLLLVSSSHDLSDQFANSEWWLHLLPF